MTAEEAIDNLKYLISEDCTDNHFDFITEIEMAIEALEEVEQYRALGTVKELKKAKEKQIAKKPISKQKFADLWLGFCPSCVESGINSEMRNCDTCGQAIDWSEEG